MDKRIGIIDLGRVGMVAAEKYISEGYEVFGYDRQPEVSAAFTRIGGTHLENPASVAAHAGIVVFLVLNDTQVLDVVLGDQSIRGLIIVAREEFQ